ncbi:MAG: hypothetical protein H7Z40_15055 [Phycisphaerae bacterium]|nr:hypothetical protein [Gemmatimonadaceae bacterium]
MWFIQTSVDALLIPTDQTGRSTLTGTAASWHHLVRDSAYGVDARADIASAPVRWSIWPWQQSGRRVQLPEALVGNEPLAFMVRAEPTRACVFADFPKPGKRRSDSTIEVIVVVPPEHFSRYESLVHFAMTLPAGYVGLTVPAPALMRDREDGAHARSLITPGTSAAMEGMEMVIARARAHKYNKSEIRPERRIMSVDAAPSSNRHDDDDEWLLFAAAPIHEQSEELETSAG